MAVWETDANGDLVLHRLGEYATGYDSDTAAPGGIHLFLRLEQRTDRIQCSLTPDEATALAHALSRAVTAYQLLQYEQPGS